MRAEPRRVDARRNRETILRAADEAFTENTGTVALEDIARRAGLGRATVYRHFPDRRALALAVAAEHLAALKLVARQRPPFRELLHAVLAMQVERRSLVRVFRELPERSQRQFTHALIAVLRPAFDEAQRDGTLRRDLQPADLALLFEMLEAALSGGPAPADRAEAVRRLVEVLLDGLFRCGANGGHRGAADRVSVTASAEAPKEKSPP
ncbi:TetR/AcrR family transcriptional regulator [Amycolatopsis albispora]|uniref:TetR/AcrR family transcriptional regulator n=1 Tax=Amycolatopsis albispora TaxID=1804986 RepID=UPI000DE2BF7E|nr:TetR/AcrR family transcriptional regulator [Amycolatopsis albispora]